MNQTPRQQIIDMLSEREYTAQQLANYFRVELPVILDHLYHIRLSVKPKKLEKKPAFCRECGFAFEERSKVKKPSKCPKCKAERIQAPLFYIKPSD